jgi:hypothetical protein
MAIRKKIAKNFSSSELTIFLLAVLNGKEKKLVRQWRDRLLLSKYLRSIDNKLDFDPFHMVTAALASMGPLSFVHVGTNDFKTCDPVFELIHQNGKRALLIEPQYIRM